MKKLFVLFTLTCFFSCSKKLSPDHDWSGRKWILKEVKGVPVQLSGTSRDANLEFITSEKKFSGSGGCNRIAGTYTLGKKNAILFGDPIATKMSCPDLAFEDLFLATLKTVDNQVEEGNLLMLKRGREVVLRLEAR